MSLQYIKKWDSSEVELWNADKHQSYLQFDFKTLDTKVFYKVILSLLTAMIKYSQSIYFSE